MKQLKCILIVINSLFSLLGVINYDFYTRFDIVIITMCCGVDMML